MPGERLQFFEDVIPDLRQVGTDMRGSCPHCGRPTLRLAMIGQDEFEPSCPTCPPGQIRDAVRAEQIAHRMPRNGAAPPPARPAPPRPAAPRGSGGWEMPLPLAAFAPPPFPVAVLPPWLRAMTEAVAMCLSVPVDAAAMFSLSCLAAACQKRVEARIREGWIETLSLWVLVVLPPANRKSPLFRQLLAPVVAYQSQLRGLTLPEIATAKAAYRILEGRLKRAEQEAVKAKTLFDQERAEEAAAEVARRLEALRVPNEPRLLVNDATPEKLGILLHDNDGRMGVMSPEGDCFEVMAGHYSNGQANLGLYLAGHSGDDWTVDRVNRASVEIRRTAISFGLTVQPDVLAGFAAKPQFRGRGLLGRFLYCVPESLLGSRPSITPAVLAVIEETYAARLGRLLALPADASEEGSPRPWLLEFDAEAGAGIARLQDWIEPQLAPWGELRSMADWAGKLAGSIARIAALLHLAELAETERPWTYPVEGYEIEALTPVRDYLIAHARTAFQSMGADAEVEQARHILAWLKAHPCSRFNRRNLHRRLIGTFPAVADMDPALVILMERGYLRQVVVESDGKPGPKSVVFDVHPDWAGGAAELASV